MIRFTQSAYAEKKLSNDGEKQDQKNPCYVCLPLSLGMRTNFKDIHILEMRMFIC